MIPVLIAAILFYLAYLAYAGTAIPVSTCCQGEISVTCAITHDPQTWPSGDRIYLICHAIAYAEGANVAGSNPDLYNNPGDISDGLMTFGADFHSGSMITRFPDKATGWQWLHDKIATIAAGKSLVYAANSPWRVIAKKWAANSDAWLTNVTNTLGVSPDSTLSDYLNS